jgi:hypothetical protein
LVEDGGAGALALADVGRDSTHDAHNKTNVRILSMAIVHRALIPFTFNELV